MSAALSTAGLSPRSAPARDRPGKATPAGIAEILAVVSILATYGRHLAKTLDQRAAARGFATIARFFGTATRDTILAHISRGLMRAIALERMLRLRAARGHDLRILAPRVASDRTPPADDAPNSAPEAGSAPPETLTSAQAAAAQRSAIGAGERLVRRIARNEMLTLDNLPSMEVIVAEVRRSPVGRTIAAICRDLGISPSLCDGAFWNRVFDAIRLYRGSLGSLVLEVKRREQRFEKKELESSGAGLAGGTRATASAACWASALANRRSIRPPLRRRRERPQRCRPRACALPPPRPGRPERCVVAVRD